MALNLSPYYALNKSTPVNIKYKVESLERLGPHAADKQESAANSFRLHSGLASLMCYSAACECSMRSQE